MRREIFQTGEYYHIYNRGVDKRDIFLDEKDYLRFLWNMRNFNDESKREERSGRKQELSSEISELSSGNAVLPKYVHIIAYCLNSNHFHFLLKQTLEKGIEKFMHKISLGYTNYINAKYNRSGSLFQGTYKAAHIKNSGQLWRLVCYINGNPEIHKICKAENWLWSSCKDYLGLRRGTLCDKQVILQDFSDLREYKNLLYAIIKENQDIKDDKDEV